MKLVMLSGGVDSVSLLKHLLLSTTDPIVCVHICAENGANRHIQELTATKSIHNELSKIRDSTLHIVNINLPGNVRDAEIQVGLIPALVTGLHATQFYRGLCYEDIRDGDHGKRKLIGSYCYNWLKNTNRSSLWNSWEELSPDLPHFYLTKKQHMDYLGELTELTWSCLTPVDHSPCGVCWACCNRM